MVNWVQNVQAVQNVQSPSLVLPRVTLIMFHI
jgi:hypothetical protein